MTVAFAKSVVFFGGSGGIGSVVADYFVSAGYGITIAARSREKLDWTLQKLNCIKPVVCQQPEKTTQELSVLESHASIKQSSTREAIGGAALPNVRRQVADVTSFESVMTVIKEHVRFFGGFDVIVNAAGLQGPIGPLWENDPHKWDEAVATNLTGVFHVCHAGIRYMLKVQRGVIILLSGGGAAYARPNFSAYGACKTGMLRLVETIHEELRIACPDGIQIYAVAPGAVRTRMTKEVLACREAAGVRAYSEAVQTDVEGGTPPEKAAELCLYLAEQRPVCLSGRLIHVNEPYKEYVMYFEDRDPGVAGMLRRQPYK